MTLEATMILMDNSEWSRNGDYMPSRWEAQNDATGLISQAKYQVNAESSVGLMTMAGKQVEVLCTPTTEHGKVMSCLHGLKLGGQIQFQNALLIAQLALKHRMNKAQRQRIVAFVASPIREDDKTLENLAKKLKKNTVAIDVISLGEMDEAQLSKLQKFVEKVNNNDNSHFLTIRPSINLVSDQLIGTPVMGGTGDVGEHHAGNEFAVDPNMDPELAMALRISLEEERERQKREKEKAEKPAQEEGKKEEESKQQAGVQPQQVQQPTQKMEEEPELDEEELLKRAKELSLLDTAGEQDQEKQTEDPKMEEEAPEDEAFIHELLKQAGINPENEDLKQKMGNVNKKGQDDKDKDNKNKQ